MKTSIRLIPLILLVLAGAASANAQDFIVKARVPFAFTVGDTTLPRGEYEVSRLDGHTSALLVRSEHQGTFILGESGDSADRANTSELVFHRYGDQYFMREIRFLGGTGVELPETRTERDAAERRSVRSSAGVDAVVVFARLQ
jgi:hypothetical protein